MIKFLIGSTQYHPRTFVETYGPVLERYNFQEGSNEFKHPTIEIENFLDYVSLHDTIQKFNKGQDRYFGGFLTYRRFQNDDMMMIKIIDYRTG